MYSFNTTKAGHLIVSQNGRKVFDIEFSYANSEAARNTQIQAAMDMIAMANSAPAGKQLITPSVASWVNGRLDK